MTLLGCGKPPAAAGAAFALTAESRALDNADLTTYTFASQGIGTEDATRKVIFGMCGRRASGSPTLSATLAGNAATSLVTVINGTATNNRLTIFGRDEPTGTTADIVGTFDTTMLRAAVDTARLVNFSGSPNTASNSTDFNTSTSMSLTVPSGGAGYVFAFTSGASLSISGTGVTQNAAQTLEFGEARSAILDVAGSITVTATVSANALILLAGVAYGP